MRRTQISRSVKTIDRSRVHGEKFNNITEFYKFLETHPIKDEFKKYGDEPSSVTGTWEWTGTESYEAATRLLLHGDPEAKSRIDQSGYKATLRNVNRTERKRTTVLAPCGFLPHVPNFLAGRPNNMFAQRIQMQRKKVLNVAYNTGACGGTDAVEMLNAASDVLSAIIRCEAGGVRINLWSVAIAKSGGDYAVSAIKIKDSAQHIDLLKMAYPMTSPSMHRRHVFRFREVLPGLPSKFADGYGMTTNDDDECEQCLKYLGIECDAILGFYKCKDWSQEQIMEYITSVNK